MKKDGNTGKQSDKYGLNKLKAQPRHKKVFGFDVETYDNNKKFLCASIIGDGYKFFSTKKKDLLNEISTNRIFRNSFICATNLMFDFFAIFKYGEAFHHFDIIERGGSLVLCSTYCKYDSKDNMFYSSNTLKQFKANMKEYYKITFVDSGSHLRTTVKQLGKIVNLPKLEAPECLGHKPDTIEEWEYMKKYNIRDSEITYRFMEFLQRHYIKLGANLKSTVSASAMDMFRRSYLKCFWEQEKRDNILYCYKGYYGGRTEAFKRGIFNSDNYGKIRSYDVNSLYPYCLRNFKFPVASQGYYKDKLRYDDVDAFNGVGYFKMTAPKDMQIPILPVKTDKLRFPVGKFEGYYDFNSVRNAVNYGYEIKEIKDGVVYENNHRPFKRLIDTLYKLRLDLKKRKDMSQIVVKLLMNSFYGKFGYNYMDKEKLGDINAVSEAIKKDLTIYPTRDRDIFRIVSGEDSKIPPYVFPIYSLYTTSYARQTMFSKFKTTGFNRVFYSDTDCIFTDRKLNSNPDDLGELKLEDEFDELCIVKAKFYAGITKDQKDIIKVKGLHGSLKNYDCFKDLVSNNKFTVNTTLFRKLRSSIGFSDKYVNQVYSMIKHIGLEDDKRMWQMPQFSTNPQDSTPIIL